MKASPSRAAGDFSFPRGIMEDMKLPQGLQNLKPLLVIAVVAVSGYALYANRERVWYKVDSVLPEGESGVVQGVLTQELKVEDFATIATGLEIPWDIAFLPGGDFLVTERPGRLKRIAPDGKVTEI